MRIKTILIVFIWTCSVLPITAQNNNERTDSANNDSIVGDSIQKKSGFLGNLFGPKDDKLDPKKEELKRLQQQYESLVKRDDSLIQIIKGFDAVKRYYADSVSNKKVAQVNMQCEEKMKMLNQRLDSICEIYLKGVYYEMMFYVSRSRYDSLAIQSQKDMFVLLELDNKIDGEMRKRKDMYFPLFERYGDITRKIYSCIVMTITDIEAKTERVRAKENFLYRIEKTNYSKDEYKYQYLDEIIEEAKQLFDDPKKFNVKEFEKLKKRLEPRKW